MQIKVNGKILEVKNCNDCDINCKHYLNICRHIPFKECLEHKFGDCINCGVAKKSFNTCPYKLSSLFEKKHDTNEVKNTHTVTFKYNQILDDPNYHNTAEEIYTHFKAEIFNFGCDYDSEIADECILSMLAKRMAIAHLILLIRKCDDHVKIQEYSKIITEIEKI